MLSSIRPFQPNLLAKTQSTRLLQSKSPHTSFEERNLRSIETRLLRKVIASTSPSPGPGHYSGMTIIKERGAVSPPPKSVLTKTRSASLARMTLSSPGKQGYSFGKGKLEKCLSGNQELSHSIPMEFRRSTYVLGPHSPPNKKKNSSFHHSNNEDGNNENSVEMMGHNDDNDDENYHG